MGVNLLDIQSDSANDAGMLNAPFYKFQALIRSVRQSGFPADLREYRKTADYQKPYTEAAPLVSVVVPTFNRANLLTERCIPSLLTQTYSNIEIIVIGDGCTDGTEEHMARFDDPRIRFENLSKRGDYPKDPEARWHVAGSVPVDYAYKLAQGLWVTRLDDDDEHSPDRIQKLLRFAQDTRAEYVYHPFHHQSADGSWWLNKSPYLRQGFVTNGSMFFHHWFKTVKIDPFWVRQFNEPGDWHRIRQMLHLGARAKRYPEPLLRHYAEHGNHGR